MARRTFTEMDAGLLSRIANRSDVTAAQRLQFLVDGYYSVANEFEHVELQAFGDGTLALGDDDFTITAADVWWPEMVKDVTAGRLLEPDDKHHIESGTKSSGTPSRYYWWGGVFYVNALPTAAHTMRVWYVQRPAEPTLADTSVLDRIFDPVIEMTAAILALQTIRDFAEAAIQEQQLQNYLAGKHLPLRKAKLDNRGAGVQVKMR